MDDRVRGVLRQAAAPLAVPEIAAALADCPPPTVAAAVATMARARQIRRVSGADGILRYTAGEPLPARDGTPAIARTYKPPAAVAPVRVVAGDAAIATSPRPAPVPKAPSPIAPTLQQHVQAVVESRPDHRWTVPEIVADVSARCGHRPVRADQVRARLHALCRSGSTSPLRRMPSDGTWMANTPAARTAAEGELQVIARVPLNRVKAARSATPSDRRREPRHPDDITDPAIDALRDLITAVITHVPRPPQPLLQCMQQGMGLLGRVVR